jgi:predicted Zn-dependent peptidase
MSSRILFAAICALSFSCATVSPGTLPADAQKAGNPAEAWRATPPKAGAPPALNIPTFQKGTLPNGLTVMVSEQHQLPVMVVTVATAAGSANDPAGKAGLADVAHKLLLEGAGKRDALEIDRAFADLGATPFVSTSPDGSLVGTRVLSRNAAAAMPLIADLVMRPQLTPAGFERRKKEHLADLAMRMSSPMFLVQEAFSSTVFGDKHPYGHSPSGTPASIGSLTAADAKAFVAKNIGPATSALIITGDVTLEQAMAWAKQHFGSWKGTAARTGAPAPADDAQARKDLVYVPKPKLIQTYLLMGRVALPAGHPDEATLNLATNIFGGFFGSRLNMNLREGKGYSYGAFSQFDPRRGAGPLLAGSAVRADVTGASVKEFLSELEGIKKRPFTQKEISAAREGLLRSLPSNFDTIESLARAGASLYWQDQPLDRFQKMAEQLQKADPRAIQAAAEKYLDPATLDLVMVGDPDTIKTQVSTLKLGELRERPPPSMPTAAPAKAAAAGSHH